MTTLSIFWGTLYIFTNSQQENLTLLLPREGLYVPGLQTAGGDAMARGPLALRRGECLQRFTHTAFQKLQSDKNMMTNWEWLQKESSRWGYWHFSHFWAPRGQKSFQRQEGIFRMPDEFKVREGSVQEFWTHQHCDSFTSRQWSHYAISENIQEEMLYGQFLGKFWRAHSSQLSEPTPCDIKSLLSCTMLPVSHLTYINITFTFPSSHAFQELLKSQ